MPLCLRCRKTLRLLCSFFLVCLAVVSGAKAELVQWLDASIASSITRDGNNRVNNWADLSGTNNAARPGGGTVTFPSTALFSSGAPGIDFGFDPNFLELFSNTSPAWLNQIGGGRGFSVVLALKVNDFTPEWNDVLGNSSTPEEGFGLRFFVDGTLQSYLGGKVLQKTSKKISRGDIVVLAFNYDAQAGRFEFWDSKSFTSRFATVPAADFRTKAPVTLGRTTSNTRSLTGLVGEVRIYDEVLTPATFRQVRETLVSKWAGLPPTAITQWRLMPENGYSRDDIMVAALRMDDPGVGLPPAPATQDCTAAFQQAIRSVASIGGGTIYIPAGQYRIDGTLELPSGVVLRGDWIKPQAGTPVTGTILKAYAGRGQETGTPFIGLNESSGVRDLAIWYPDQNPKSIQPYPPTIQSWSGSNHNIQNVTLVNPYVGISTLLVDSIGVEGAPFLRNIYGTPLKVGIELDSLGEVGRVETVQFSPTFWKESGLPGSPLKDEDADWIAANGTGMILRRIDWSGAAYVSVDGYNIGLALRQSRFPGDATFPNGQCYAFILNHCQTGVWIDDTHYAGVMMTRFTITNAGTAVYSGAASKNIAQFHTCNFDASNFAVLNEGKEKLLFQNCQFNRGAVRAINGSLVITNSAFGPTTLNHIELFGTVRASLVGNWFDGEAKIQNGSAQTVYIDQTPLAGEQLPEYNYAKPAGSFKPKKAALFVVTGPDYRAVGDGSADDTAAFRSALTAAKTNGGGIVFVPAGFYRLTDNLVIPTGVELRGIFDISHGTKGLGSVVLVYAGRNQENGTPFIQLESGSGLRGLTFHYPAQIYDPTDTVHFGMVPYPFLLRGKGPDIYITNIAATVPYQLLDLATYRCDRHYVDYIWSTAIKTGIVVGGGSTDGQLQNCQLNPSSYEQASFYYDSIPFVPNPDITTLLWSQARPYIFGNIASEILHQDFVFGGNVGVQLTNEGGTGPSAHCLGLGVDQSVRSLVIESVGANGFSPINTQLVSVDDTTGRYVELEKTFGGMITLFSTATWGRAASGVVVNSGELHLDLFHSNRVAVNAYEVRDNGRLRTVNGNVTNTVSNLVLTQPSSSVSIIATLANVRPSALPKSSSTLLFAANLSTTTDSIVASPSPSGLKADALDVPAALSWNKSNDPNFNYFTLYRSSGGAFSQIASRLTSPSFLDTTALAGTRYSYSVSSVNSSSNESATASPVSLIARSTTDGSRITNFSVQANVSSGNDAVTLAFTLEGAGDKPVLLRGFGLPSLAAANSPSQADPALYVYSGSDRLLATNRNWLSADNAVAIDARQSQLGGLPILASKDAAILQTFTPGNYTAQIVNEDGLPGRVLGELDDLAGDSASSRLNRISARVAAGGIEGPATMNFTIVGGLAKTLLIRGIGPGLAQTGFTGFIADPRLTLFLKGASTPLYNNDNWQEAANQDAIANVTTLLAPAIVLQPKDAALLVSLPPGSYSVELNGTNQGAGLVEIWYVIGN